MKNNDETPRKDDRYHRQSRARALRTALFNAAVGMSCYVRLNGVSSSRLSGAGCWPARIDLPRRKRRQAGQDRFPVYPKLGRLNVHPRQCPGVRRPNGSVQTNADSVARYRSSYGHDTWPRSEPVSVRAPSHRDLSDAGRTCPNRTRSRPSASQARVNTQVAVDRFLAPLPVATEVVTGPIATFMLSVQASRRRSGFPPRSWSAPFTSSRSAVPQPRHRPLRAGGRERGGGDRGDRSQGCGWQPRPERKSVRAPEHDALHARDGP